MRIFRGIVGFCGALLCVFLSSSRAHDFSSIRSKYEEAIVFIESKRIRKDGSGREERRYGTGFVISRLGFVMTASHVVFPDHDDYTVETKGAIKSRYEQMYRVEEVRRDGETMLLVFPDLARKWRFIEFGDSRATKNDAALYTLGFPGTDLAPASGVLANRVGPKGMWQTTIPINRGNSGGPIFNTAGKVVAIAYGGDDEKQQVTYGIPAAFVQGLIQMAATAIDDKGVVFVGSSAPLFASDAKFVSQTFQYYIAAEPNSGVMQATSYCLPLGYTVTKVRSGSETKSGSMSKLVALERSDESPNCVSVKAMAGVGDIVNASEFQKPWWGSKIRVEGMLYPGTGGRGGNTKDRVFRIDKSGSSNSGGTSSSINASGSITSESVTSGTSSGSGAKPDRGIPDPSTVRPR